MTGRRGAGQCPWPGLGAAVPALPVAAAAKSLQSCPILCDPIDQAPPSMGFSGQQYWSGVLLPSPAALPRPHLKPKLPDPWPLLSGFSVPVSSEASAHILFPQTWLF